MAYQRFSLFPDSPSFKDLFSARSLRYRWRNGDPVITTAIMAICIVVWAIEAVLFLVWPEGGNAFVNAGMLLPATAVRHPWTFITSMFLHQPTSLWHILFNMLTLWCVGPVLERMMGHWPYLALYLLSGLGGGAGLMVWAVCSPSGWMTAAYGASGALFGGLWALIPAFFKARWGTNETLFTLMMNYIIIGVVKWLQGGPWEKIPRGSQQIEQFASNACLPRVAGVYCGWIIVLVLTVLMFLYMRYTKHGYEIAVIGESENTARYAGMNVGWIIMRTMFLSGAIAGIVGFLLVSGANNTLYSGVANNAGFTAITVAWLAQLNPFAMVGISALLAVLQKGADTLNTQMSIPVSLSDVITGVLLFFMLGCEFFINYRLIFRGAEERQARKEAAKS